MHDEIPDSTRSNSTKLRNSTTPQNSIGIRLCIATRVAPIQVPLSLLALLPFIGLAVSHHVCLAAKSHFFKLCDRGTCFVRLLLWFSVSCIPLTRTVFVARTRSLCIGHRSMPSAVRSGRVLLSIFLNNEPTRHRRVPVPS